MRLIDADVAVAKCNEDIEAVKDIPQRVDGILDAIMNIHECPTVDAVPVVRCEDCAYHKDDNVGHWCEHTLVTFEGVCKNGKRRTDETD